MPRAAARAARFGNIDGVPTFYMRTDDGKTPYVFYSSTRLHSALVNFKRDLNNYTKPAGYGEITAIISGGTYVEKAKSAHRHGNAFDIDRVEWSSERACSPIYKVHAHEKQVYRLRYFALDAVCRQHFRFVLDANFNADHHDHIHVDLSGLPVKLGTGARSDTVFVQAVCNEFANQGLVVDGKWGRKTSHGLKQTLAMADLDHLNPRRSSADYRKFMQRVSQFGFRGKTFA